MVVRSSLEEMLETLQRIDDNPIDVPPALPIRPTSRGRLPSARRNFKVEKFVLKSLDDNLPDLESYEESSEEEDLFHSHAEFSDPVVRFKEKLMRSGEKKNFVLKKKLRVWCQFPDTGWELGYVQSLSGQHAKILLSDGKISTVPGESLLPANPNDGTDDLIKLIYLNEPSVLHSLKCRYSDDMIYTKAGPILVALNPLKKVHLYGNDFLGAYRCKTLDAPHVFAVADAAFSGMMRDGINQSIIISGESGAGKTETAKITMQYLAALGGGGGMEHKILETNPILEAFGNAKTSRNDNSSRFGKLFAIQFSATGTICGAKMQTFLLEKLRVVQRAKGERSYHIFYQLCAGAPLVLREKFNLKPAHEYEYLKQSDSLSIPEVDDAQMFHMLMEAFNTVQICKEDQENTFAMIAAVLWLGNVKFEVIDNEEHVQVIPGDGVTNAAKLMGCEVDKLMLALSTSTIQTRNDSIVQRLTLQQAIDTRDALAKSIYDCLFEWLVELINNSLEAGKRCTERCISILDIYGFESFHNNQFEQFCINYTNERLQQYFNQHVFKHEQQEYTQDGIDWSNYNFTDNTECLNLFEKVLYDTSGFLEKNRDPLYSDLVQLLQSCSCKLLGLFASRMLNQSKRSTSPQWLCSFNSQKYGVGAKFKAQLLRLMQRLENTTPHFIRCIKPNSEQLPGMFENDVVLEQLRCCGVLEVVRISRSGYPTRITCQQFAERYGFLFLDNVDFQDPLSVSISILRQYNIPPEMYQVGYTKLCFRSGQIAALENARKNAIERIIWAQKQYRGLQAYRRFRKLKQAAIILQSFIRGYLARKKFCILKGYGREELFHEKTNGETHKILQERKAFSEKHHQVQALALADLQSRVLQAEAMLSQKEDECAALREKLQLSNIKWFENDIKMISKEEMWRKQITSLQLSIIESKKTQPRGRPDLEDDVISTRMHTPEATPPRRLSVPTAAPAGDHESKNGRVGPLVWELEQRMQAFEEDARLIHQPYPEEELRKLKVRFTSWKKDFKARLKETKAALRKSEVAEGDKKRKKWWVKRAMKL